MDLTPANDFFSNIKDKLTSPFFGSLIFVWVLRNWDLVYSFFNFDEKMSRSQKIKYFNDYISTKNFFYEAAINIFCALVIILIGYILITCTKAMSVFFDNTALSWVTNIVSRGKVVDAGLFNDAIKERSEYSEKYEAERQKVRDYSKQYDQIDADYKSQREQNRVDIQRITSLESQANNFMTEINSKSEENHRLSLVNATLEAEVDSLKDGVVKLRNDINFQKETIIESENERKNLLQNAEKASAKHSQEISNLQLVQSESIKNYEESILMLQHKVSDLTEEIEKVRKDLNISQNINLKYIADFLNSRVANDIRKYGHRTDKYLILAADLDLIETYNEVGQPVYLYPDLTPIDMDTAFNFVNGREFIREIIIGTNQGKPLSNHNYRNDPNFFNQN